MTNRAANLVVVLLIVGCNDRFTPQTDPQDLYDVTVSLAGTDLLLEGVGESTAVWYTMDATDTCGAFDHVGVAAPDDSLSLRLRYTSAGATSSAIGSYRERRLFGSVAAPISDETSVTVELFDLTVCDYDGSSCEPLVGNATVVMEGVRVNARSAVDESDSVPTDPVTGDAICRSLPPRI